MRERRYGRIVVMSSFAARCGSPGQVAYCASKAGLLGMAKNIASENVSLGITCNSILPGLIGTPKVRALPDELLDRFREGSGLLGTGRVGEPEEIAGLVAYLASAEAGYVTGQEIVVAGGGDLLPGLAGIIPAVKLGLSLGYWTRGPAPGTLELRARGRAARLRLGVDRRGLRVRRADAAGVVGRADRADQARHGDHAAVGARAHRHGDGGAVARPPVAAGASSPASASPARRWSRAGTARRSPSRSRARASTSGSCARSSRARGR